MLSRGGIPPNAQSRDWDTVLVFDLEISRCDRGSERSELLRKQPLDPVAALRGEDESNTIPYQTGRISG